MKLKFDYFTKGLFTLLMVVGLSSFAFGQRTVTGTVTDGDSGEGLIGASVLVKGTGSGTITDFDGSYSVSVPDGATELVFSYTGYSAQTVVLGASNTVDVKMAQGTILDEVVVVGYGSLTNKEVTSAVTSVKEEDFNQGNVNNPAELLQGKVAGLSITRAGGDPNGDYNIRLRGLSTFGAQIEPLVVIDGVIGASLDNLDPNDIASIDVLKDGSAAAIYGTRGSSGVIIVTTKKGVPGKTKVEYNGYVASAAIDRTIPVMSSSEYVAAGGTDLGSSTNWIDEITESGLTHSHGLALSGGAGNGNYRVSLNYRDNDGILRGSGFQRLNARVNLSQKALNDKLTLNFNVAASDKKSQFSFEEAFRYATYYNPSAPILADDEANGGYYQQDNFDYFNPVAMIDQNINEGVEKRLLASMRASYALTDDLSIGAFYSRENTDEVFGQYYSKFSRFRGQNTNGLARRATNDLSSELFESTLNYGTDLGDIGLKALVGYSYQDFQNRGQGVSAGDFLTDVFDYNNLGASAQLARGEAGVYSYRNGNRLIGFFGRLNMDYDDTYFVSAAVRRDGSSRFAEANQTGLFYSVSASALLSNMMDVDAIDNLKLRVSYGKTGNDAARNYQSIFAFAPSGGTYPINGVNVAGYGPTWNANRELKWEEKGEFDIGLDFAAMDYRLTGTIDYYQRTTTDLLLEVPADVTTSAASTIYANVGELKNNGLEVALNYAVVQSEDFNYTTSVAYNNYLSTEVVSLNSEFYKFAPEGNFQTANLGAPGLNSTNLILVEEGQPIGQIWGPQYNGVNDDGTWNLTDVDGNGAIDLADNVVIGNGLPDFDLNWNNSFNFGNLDVNLLFRGSFGHDLVNTYRVFYEQLNPGSIGSYNRVKTEFFNENLTDAPLFSDFYVENASFFKLDNATIGYNVDLADGSAFNRCRVYVSGQNLLTFTNYSGVDPEVRWSDDGTTDNGGDQATTGNALAPGIERRNTYFTARTFTLGVNLGF